MFKKVLATVVTSLILTTGGATAAFAVSAPSTPVISSISQASSTSACKRLVNINASVSKNGGSAIRGWDISYRLSTSSTWSTIGTSTKGNLSNYKTCFPSSGTFVVRLKAYNASYGSAWSATKNVVVSYK